MNFRQYEILKNAFESKNLKISQLIQLYEVTSRTLYYDIESINNELSHIGNILIINKKLYFRGDENECERLLTEKKYLSDKKSRDELILFLILTEKVTNIASIAKELEVSKNTVFNSINDLKILLKRNSLKLHYKKDCYLIIGDEIKVRNLYLNYLFKYDNYLDRTDISALEFNKKSKLSLTDNSLRYLSNFKNFI